MEKTTDVIIPTYRPGKEFGRLIERLQKQSCPIHRIIIMNTEEKFWNKEWDEKYPFLEVHHIPKAEFDHGGTRKKAAALSEADIMVFMTQDALPADRELIQNLTGALCSDEQIGAAYARQLPNAECSFVERYTRSFNRKFPALRRRLIFPGMVSRHISAPMYVLLIRKIFLRSLEAL